MRMFVRVLSVDATLGGVLVLLVWFTLPGSDEKGAKDIKDKEEIAQVAAIALRLLFVQGIGFIFI